ncbi:MAG: PAS domain-containing protein [Verrucomicrobia bacterium]|nr:PAS domain-containing protein [Verrucomicrobiota bacterium]
MTDLTNPPLSPFLGESETLSKVLMRIEAEPARVFTDEKGEVIAINPAFSNLCGYTFNEVRGKKPGAFLQGPATTPESLAPLRAAIQTGTSCVTEVLNYHKDQSIYRVQIELHPWKDEKSSLKGFMAIERKLP